MGIACRSAHPDCLAAQTRGDTLSRPAAGHVTSRRVVCGPVRVAVRPACGPCCLVQEQRRAVRVEDAFDCDSGRGGGGVGAGAVGESCSYIGQIVFWGLLI